MAFFRQDRDYREEERRKARERYEANAVGIFQTMSEWDPEFLCDSDSDIPLTKEEVRRLNLRKKNEEDRQKLKIIHQLCNGSLRKNFWDGKTEYDYPFLLDAQFKKNPTLAIWMDTQRIKQHWVCTECGVPFGEKNCGKCPRLGVSCMEKGCKFECKTCTRSQKIYLEGYPLWVKARCDGSDKPFTCWYNAFMTCKVTCDGSDKTKEDWYDTFLTCQEHYDTPCQLCHLMPTLTLDDE